MKKMLIALTAAVVMLIGVVAVGAQDSVGPREGFRGEVSTLAQEYTGLTDAELRTALRDGTTLAALIEANGASVDDYVAASVVEAQARLDDAVANGRMTQAQADEMAADLEMNITARVNGVYEGRDDVLRGEVSTLAQEYTGLTSEELQTALRDGTTLAALIEANGASVDDYVAASVAEVQARLDDAVANEWITQERADELAADLETNITARVNGTFEGRDGKHGGRGGNGGPRGGNDDGRGSF
jgi:hypothetical protein